MSFTSSAMEQMTGNVVDFTEYLVQPNKSEIRGDQKGQMYASWSSNLNFSYKEHFEDSNTG